MSRRARRGAWLRGASCAFVFAAGACGGTPTRPTPPPPPPQLGLSCPADIQTTSPDGNPIAVIFAPETTGGTAPVTVTCSPESGSRFALGTTAVTCTARDAGTQTAGCQFNVAISPPPRLRYTTFMAFGDSVTEGVVSPAEGVLALDPTEAYPTKLQQMLRARYTAQTITVINAGKAGEFAKNARPRLAGAMSEWRPQVVLLSEGTNDLNALGLAGIEPTAFAMEDMVREILLARTVAVVGTIPPMRPDYPKAHCPECVQPYNSRVAALTSGKGARQVDTYSALAANIPLFLGIDGIHPTPAGYDVIAKAYFDAIVAWFEEPTTTISTSTPGFSAIHDGRQ